MECVACEGHDPKCVECHGDGEVSVCECPTKLAGKAGGIVEMSDYLEECKTFPLGGGVLDQTESFLDSHRYYRGQVDHWTAERLRPKTNG